MGQPTCGGSRWADIADCNGFDTCTVHCNDVWVGMLPLGVCSRSMWVCRKRENIGVEWNRQGLGWVVRERFKPRWLPLLTLLYQKDLVGGVQTPSTSDSCPCFFSYCNSCLYFKHVLIWTLDLSDDLGHYAWRHWAELPPPPGKCFELVTNPGFVFSNVHFTSVFRPVSASAKLYINPYAEMELKNPKIDWCMEVQSIAVELTKPQVR